MNNTSCHTHIVIMSIVCMVVGLLLRYLIGRRRFNRWSSTGLQQFRNYNYALVVPVFERVLNLIGLVLMVVGVLLYVIR